MWEWVQGSGVVHRKGFSPRRDPGLNPLGERLVKGTMQYVDCGRVEGLEEQEEGPVGVLQEGGRGRVRWGSRKPPGGAPVLVSVELMGAVGRGSENVHWGGQGGAEVGSGVVARMEAVGQRDMAEECPIEGLHGAVGRGPGVASVLACRKRCGRKKSDAKGDGQGPRRWTETSGNC